MHVNNVLNSQSPDSDVLISYLTTQTENGWGSYAGDLSQ